MNSNSSCRSDSKEQPPITFEPRLCEELLYRLEEAAHLICDGECDELKQLLEQIPQLLNQILCPYIDPEHSESHKYYPLHKRTLLTFAAFMERKAIRDMIIHNFKGSANVRDGYGKTVYETQSSWEHHCLKSQSVPNQEEVCDEIMVRGFCHAATHVDRRVPPLVVSQIIGYYPDFWVSELIGTSKGGVPFELFKGYESFIENIVFTRLRSGSHNGFLGIQSVEFRDAQNNSDTLHTPMVPYPQPGPIYKKELSFKDKPPVMECQVEFGGYANEPFLNSIRIIFWDNSSQEVRWKRRDKNASYVVIEPPESYVLCGLVGFCGCFLDTISFVFVRRVQ